MGFKVYWVSRFIVQRNISARILHRAIPGVNNFFAVQQIIAILTPVHFTALGF